jgi:ribosomal protein L37AE/L43A
LSKNLIQNLNRSPHTKLTDIVMSDCPSCNSRLLRHFGQKKVYWYCQKCRQEMPNYEDILELETNPREELERILYLYNLKQIVMQSSQ